MIKFKYSPVKMNDGTWGWQCAFADAHASPFVVPYQAWVNLESVWMVDHNPITLFKTFRSRSDAIDALRRAYDNMKRFVDSCEISE